MSQISDLPACLPLLPCDLCVYLCMCMCVCGSSMCVDGRLISRPARRRRLYTTTTHHNPLQPTATLFDSMDEEKRGWSILQQYTTTHCNTLQLYPTPIWTRRSVGGVCHAYIYSKPIYSTCVHSRFLSSPIQLMSLQYVYTSTRRLGQSSAISAILHVQSSHNRNASAYFVASWSSYKTPMNRYDLNGDFPLSTCLCLTALF